MINEAKEREAFGAWAAKEPYQLERRRDVYYASDTWHAHHGYMARAHKAAEDAEKWLPIESAPKDGTEILLGWAGRGRAFGQWEKELVADEDIVLDGGVVFAQKGDVLQSADWRYGDEGFLAGEDQPTHWMNFALPPPPAQEGDGV